MKSTSFMALAAPLLALMIPACKQDTISLDELRGKVEAIESEVVALKQTTTRLRGELERARKDAIESNEALESAEKSTREVQSQQEALVQAFASYRDDYRQSILKRSIGMDLGTLTIGTKTYTNVRVRSLDAWELVFNHSGGLGRADLKDLPPRLQGLFAFNPDAGPKPEAVAANRAMQIPADLAKVPDSPDSKVAAPLNTIAQPRAQVPSGGIDCAKPGDTISKSNGQAVEVLTRWSGGSSGTKVKGATATVPQGYRPIGSSYSGTAMDKARKGDKDQNH